MKKSEIYINKKRKLFKIIFLVPTILFLFLCNSAIFTPGFDFSELRYVLIGEIFLIGIWFTISHIVSSIIASIFYRNNSLVEDKNDVSEINEKNNQFLNINNNNLDEKVFEYNFDNSSLYKIQGELMYFFNNKDKYLNSDGKMRIKNQLTIFIVVGIISGICLAISIGIKCLIICYIALIILIYSLIKKNTIKKESNSKIIITKNGIKVESSMQLYIEWEKLELIGLTRNVLIIIIKNSRVPVIIEPKEEIINEIKKYTKAKIIIDR